MAEGYEFDNDDVEFEYPYPLYRVPGAAAVRRLTELRERGDGVPVILGNEESFDRVVEMMDMNDSYSTEELIEMAGTIDPVEWFDRRRESFRRTLEEEGDDYDDVLGEWPEGVRPNTRLTAHRNVVTDRPHPEVLVTLLPAEQHWMAPAYLRIGNWNEVPRADEHTALFRYWSEKYGATVACIAHDVIEFAVERPPRTQEEALELALEHYLYCGDIVDQGVDSVRALAAVLLNATVWYFWWD